MTLLFVGLNAALQRRIALEDLQLGAVNRATASSSGIGGKGQGAFVAGLQLAKDDGEVPPRLLQLLGRGPEGDQVTSLILAKAGTTEEDPLWKRIAAPCRVCTTLVDGKTGDATEIVEPSGFVTETEWKELIAPLEEQVTNCPWAGCAIMGSTPPGVPSDGYGQLVGSLCSPSTRLLVDSVVGVVATLEAAAEVGCVVVLKLNARELLKLAGAEVPGGSESAVPAEAETVARAAHTWAAGLGAAAKTLCSICWTDGPFPGGVVDVRSGRRWSIDRQGELPAAVVSPIGAGDATSAGTLHMWCKLEAAAAVACNSGDVARLVAEAFAFGMAVGAASCLTASNAEFNMMDVRRIHAAIAVTELAAAV